MQSVVVVVNHFHCPGGNKHIAPQLGILGDLGFVKGKGGWGVGRRAWGCIWEMRDPEEWYSGGIIEGGDDDTNLKGHLSMACCWGQ